MTWSLQATKLMPAAASAAPTAASRATVGEHRPGVEPRRELRNFAAGMTVDCQQGAAVFAQSAVEFAHAVPDEFDAPIGARQGVENLAVEHKSAVDAAAGAQRARQRGVIAQPQIAPEPDQVGVVTHSDIRRTERIMGALATRRSRSDPGRERVRGALPANGWLQL